MIPIDQIMSNPHQPRKHFDSEKLTALSQSIKHDGVLQPIMVQRRGDAYELIMGERRLQAVRMAGIAMVPAVIRPVTSVESLRLALVENLQRENLGPIEVAEAYHALIDEFGLSQNELADLVGKDRSSVANTLRLLNLPPELRALVDTGRLPEGHARALLALPTVDAQIALGRRTVKEKLSVREVETEVNRRGKTMKDTPKKSKPAHIDFLEKALSSHLSTRVTIEEKRGGKGKMVIEFYSHDDFERLAELMHIPLPR
jgi:ParB family chromosome partitioning protein